MTLVKRSKTWHCHFVVNGQRFRQSLDTFRQSLDTKDWREAQSKEKHVKSWRTGWRMLTKKAVLPGFRFHDLRHCAITQLAENGTSDSTIMAIAGHVSRRMLKRYSHVRMEAKRNAMEALAVSTKTAGYDTNHDTNAVVVRVRPV